MPPFHPSDRLTSEDAAFLYLETTETPLHIGSVSIFDGPLPRERFVEFLATRLPLIPRYRQRVIVPPMNFGHPTWEPDPDFNIENHVASVRLKKGTKAELEAVSGQIFSELMDRTKPLWDITLIDGLAGGRSALLCRVHHCLVDGVSGVGLLNVILGATPESAFTPKAGPYKAPPLPGPASSLADAMVSSVSEMMDRFFSAQMAALNIAQALVTDHVREGLNELLRLVPELLSPVELLPFNQPCRGPRKVVWTEVSIDDVGAIRRACGGTLNDVVLAVVTLAVQRYALLHKQSIDKRLLRLMVPVNLRRDGTDNGLGNQVSLLPVSVPLDIRDPVEMLDAVHQRTQALKSARVADLVHLLATWVGATPAPVQALLGPLAQVLPVPPFNMVCTNVPGPQFPLFALGRKMLTYYPYVPIANQMSVGCAVQSYNHRLFFGLTADRAAAGDVARLRGFLDSAFDDLRKASGIAVRPKAATTRGCAGKEEKTRRAGWGAHEPREPYPRRGNSRRLNPVPLLCHTIYIEAVQA